MALASLFVSEHGAFARLPTPNRSRLREGSFGCLRVLGRGSALA